MRKFLVAAALAGSVATGLAVAPAAQAATVEASASTGGWGKYFSSDGKAYTFGKTFKSHGKVYTQWHGVDKFGGKRGYVWFEYYKGGHWNKFSQGWDGKHSGSWNGKGIKKIYTYTCWGSSKFDNCGKKFRIY
ncbi:MULTISPECIES: hypothetical protein [Nonomuraea]|uniref:Uncharacterized protein n=2 Tax=Nonomuraea TaxID=83681 RepID=A0A7W5VBV1_9ACTN|nr:hypothetical protein [Nonomuraea dietziae]MBB3728635.1 hypothetical protein [Nonomuraea dietziae]